MDPSGSNSHKSSNCEPAQGTSQSSGQRTTGHNSVLKCLKCPFTCEGSTEFFKHIIGCGTDAGTSIRPGEGTSNSRPSTS
ncbi:unnamed protein product [Hermetia illucens]|uniref:Uncharacterized protein n=1 Tax=Hermetia illucens TaxID=343691 RepID=A0A7R8V4U4_HERIL|nr:unnamed protein product [Hermetia illucens]